MEDIRIYDSDLKLLADGTSWPSRRVEYYKVWNWEDLINRPVAFSIDCDAWMSNAGWTHQRALNLDRAGVDSITIGEMNFYQQCRYNVHSYIHSRFVQYLTRENHALLSAMLLNQSALLDQMVKDQFRYAGLYHILVISGLHFSIVAGIIGILFYFFPGYRWKRVAIAFLLTLYLLLIGWKSSIGRAYLMILIYLLAPVFYFRISKYQVLLLSAALLLGWNPEVYRELGFQLTYLATLGIFWGLDFSAKWRKDLTKTTARWIFNYFLLPSVLTSFITLLIGPLLIFHFGLIHPYAFIGNMLIGLPLSVAISGGFLLALFSPIPFAACALGGIVNTAGSGLLTMTGWFAQHPWAYWQVHWFQSIEALMGYYAGLFALSAGLWLYKKI